MSHITGRMRLIQETIAILEYVPRAISISEDNRMLSGEIPHPCCISAPRSIRILGKTIIRLTVLLQIWCGNLLKRRPKATRESEHAQQSDNKKPFHNFLHKIKAPGLRYRPQSLILNRCNASVLNILQSMPEIKGVVYV